MNFSEGYDPEKAPDYRIVMRHPAVKRLALAEDLPLPEAAALVMAADARARGAETALHERVLTRHARILETALFLEVCAAVS